MRIRPRLLALGLVLPLAGLGSDEPPPVPAFARELPRIESGSPVFAFNGRDLTGFYVYTRDHGYDDPNGICTVRDGVIRISGQEFGGLATCGNFGDYHLVVEWKWGGKNVGPARDQEPRLGHPPALRRAGRGGGVSLDGVDRVIEDHRGGMRRSPHGRRRGANPG